MIADLIHTILLLAATAAPQVENRSLRLGVETTPDLLGYSLDAEFSFRIIGAGAELWFFFPGVDDPAEFAGVEVDGRFIDGSLVRTGEHPLHGRIFTLRASDAGMSTGSHTLRVRSGRLSTPERGFTRWGAWHPWLMDRSISVPIELEVRTDSKYSVISSGRHISERVASGVRTSTWITDRRQSWVFLAVGAFRTVTFEVEGYSFDVSWSESTPIDPQLVAKAEPHRIVKFYQQTFGHSGPPSFRLIVFPDESLQRFAIDGLIGLSRGGYPATDSEYLRTVLAHEMAHYWWGDVVQASGPGAGWLAEGFAEYSRHLYEMSIGAPGLPWSFRNLAVVSRFADADPVPISGDPARVPPEIAYQKGIFVLRMLGDEIGDGTLRRAMRAFVQKADSQAVTAREFEQIVEREAGRSLDTFFRQWLDRARGPILNLDSVSVESRAGTYVIRGTLVQDGPAYDLAVPIALLLKNGDTIVSTVRTDRTRTEFRLEANDTPEKLIIDPEFRIFKWYPPARLPVTLADAWRSLGTGTPRLVFGDDIDAQTQARVSLFLRARFPRLVTNRLDDDGGSAILVGTPAARLRLERGAQIDHPPPGTLQAFVMRSAHDPAQVLIGIEGDWPEQLPEIIPQAALMFVRYRQGAIVSAISSGLTATSLQLQAAPGR